MPAIYDKSRGELLLCPRRALLLRYGCRRRISPPCTCSFPLRMQTMSLVATARLRLVDSPTSTTPSSAMAPPNRRQTRCLWISNGAPSARTRGPWRRTRVGQRQKPLAISTSRRPHTCPQTAKQIAAIANFRPFSTRSLPLLRLSLSGHGQAHRASCAHRHRLVSCSTPYCAFVPSVALAAAAPCPTSNSSHRGESLYHFVHVAQSQSLRRSRLPHC